MNETPEFSLLLLLTHPQPDLQPDAIRQFLSENKINWSELLKNIKWHRVTPQAYDSLKSHAEFVPEPIIKKLQQSCMQCKKNSLLQAAFLVKIASIFREHHIKFVAFKGVTLSQLLYSNIATREAYDIDIIIDFEDLEHAEKLLIESLGFLRVVPEVTATRKQMHFLNKSMKDRTYSQRQGEVILELHWRFNIIDQFFNIPVPVIYKTSELVYLYGENINILSKEYLWLYQSLHGSMSSWYRLHWINDIARMLVVLPLDWDRLMESSDRYQCRKNLVEAVMLAASLYNLPVPGQIKQSFYCDKKQQAQLKLVRKSVQVMRIHSIAAAFRRKLFFLPPRFFMRYFLGQLRISPTDFKLFPLPDRFFFLYYWLRPIFRIIRIFK